MKAFIDEILRRFPEVEPLLDDFDKTSAYNAVGGIVFWLTSKPKSKVDKAVIRRLVEFNRWCLEQPRGQTAENDIVTIFQVAFVEELFKYDELLPLVGHLVSRKHLIENREYFTRWIGNDRYEAALRQLG